MAFKDVKTAQSNEQKTICCLVLDVSGSMNGEPIRKLNQGISEFYQQISDDETTAQRLEIAVIAFNDEITVIQQPALIDLCGNPPVLDADGTTKMVDAVREAITLIKNQKQVYKASGQTYNRPWIVLITDGEPDRGQDVSGLGKEIKAAMKNKEFVFQAIGVDDDADMNVGCN